MRIEKENHELEAYLMPLESPPFRKDLVILHNHLKQHLNQEFNNMASMIDHLAKELDDIREILEKEQTIIRSKHEF